jgi:hypothetical protein
MSVRLHRTRLSPACELTIAFVTMVCWPVRRPTGGARLRRRRDMDDRARAVGAHRRQQAPDELLTAPSGATD